MHLKNLVQGFIFKANAGKYCNKLFYSKVYFNKKNDATCLYEELYILSSHTSIITYNNTKNF